MLGDHLDVCSFTRTPTRMLTKMPTKMPTMTLSLSMAWLLAVATVTPVSVAQGHRCSKPRCPCAPLP